MARLIRYKWLILLSCFLAALLVLGFALIVFTEYYTAQWLVGVVSTLGLTGSIILFVLFFVLLLIFGYFLFNVSQTAVFVFTLLLIIEIGYGSHLVKKIMTEQVHDYVQQLVNQTADLVQIEAHARLKARIFALNHLGTSIGLSNRDPLEQDWVTDAHQIAELFPGFQAIEWVDPDYKIRWIAPLKGNEAFLNQLVHTELKHQAILQRVKQNRTALFSDAMDLQNGGQGFLLYVPVFRQDVFLGYLVGVVNFNSLFNVLFDRDIVPNYSISVFVAGQQVYTRGDQELDLQARWQHEVRFDYQNLDFKFSIWPDRQLVGNEGKVIGSTLNFIGLLMILLLLMAVGLVLLMQRATKRLRKEMLAREQAETAREHMKKAMMQSQKLEAIGTLAGGIAHNFNNILYAIKGYVGMARADVPSDTLIHQNLGKVLEASERGQELVNGILAFSRRDNTAFVSVPLKKVILSAVQLLRSTLPATLIIKHNLVCDAERVMGNYTQLQQVFMNLIRNAVEAMNDNGLITVTANIETRTDYLKSLYPGLHCQPYFMVKVLDQGPGIPDDVIDRVFEPFFTTKDVDKGTGLGLATVRAIIEEHGGAVVVQSDAGHGSCFIVLLPVCDDTAQEN